jgi:hypothetical protein
MRTSPESISFRHSTNLEHSPETFKNLKVSVRRSPQQAVTWENTEDGQDGRTNELTPFGAGS